ncbi:MAG TPA: ATP-grasp domain-containing protein [Solirubrobacteraceae bacterium]|nr:ATP-grasp domain-containing protein [Solirubrobacteraceae bacterium]
MSTSSRLAAAVPVARRRRAIPSGQPPAGEVGAVVLGGDYQGLGIVRSLGRNGVPACVVDDERSIGRLSRYCRSCDRVADLGDEQRLVDDLLRLGERRGWGGWVLYPTRDETVAALSRRRDRLSEYFRVPTAPWEAIRWAWDKRNTYELAVAAGVAAPRTWQPASLEALDEIDGEPPWAIKPAIKEHFFYVTKAKAWRADTRAELRERFERAREIVGPGEVLVQELIPGGGEQQFAYGALYKRGRPVATMVARRRRQHPPDFGRASTYVETICDPEVEALSERLLRRIQYDGLVELEYKRDPRSGELKLLDFNARTWGYHTVARAAGVDFPYLLFRQQVGLPVEPQSTTPGVRWVRLLTDLPTGLVQLRARDFGVRDYLRSLRRADTEAVFSAEDPLPGLAELALLPYLAVKRGF